MLDALSCKVAYLPDLRGRKATPHSTSLIARPVRVSIEKGGVIRLERFSFFFTFVPGVRFLPAAVRQICRCTGRVGVI